MSHIIWTRPASADLERLYAFLREKDADAARKAMGVIQTSLQVLLDNPRIGRNAAFPPDGKREWPIRFGSAGYVVLYHLRDDEIIILRVKHMKETGFLED